MFSFFIAFIAIIGLLILHESGHFFLAKKFGMKVEEFGIFYPPRIFAKKIGETIYSLNLLPLGAFVRIFGERKKGHPRAFGSKSFLERFWVIFGGVLSFWMISAILFSAVMNFGFIQAVTDEANKDLKKIRVQVVVVVPESPAGKAGLKMGDAIIRVKDQKAKIKDIDKVAQVQEFTQTHLGEEITLTIQRGKEVFDVSLIPRVSPPIGEGPMGVALVRTAQKIYPFWETPFRGALATLKTTYFVIFGWGKALRNLVLGQPTGIKLVGPVGAFNLLNQAASQGLNYFLQFVGTISIYIALFNILPIPPTDGGKLMFLFLEKLRGKEISEKVEVRITSLFVFLLITLTILITIKDIKNILKIYR